MDLKEARYRLEKGNAIEQMAAAEYLDDWGSLRDIARLLEAMCSGKNNATIEVYAKAVEKILRCHSISDLAM